MILEAAMLQVMPGQEAPFEAAFRQAAAISAAIPCSRSHELHRCLEAPAKYLLLVRWGRLEDHTRGFRGSPRSQEWSELLHGFDDLFPTVEQFRAVHPGPATAHPPPGQRDG